MYIPRFGYISGYLYEEKLASLSTLYYASRKMILEGGLFMGNGQGAGQNGFLGLSTEQIMKILYEEFSKSGFQFNNFNAMMPPIISRMLMENGFMSGNNITQMLLKGMMGSMFKK